MRVGSLAALDTLRDGANAAGLMVRPQASETEPRRAPSSTRRNMVVDVELIDIFDFSLFRVSCQKKKKVSVYAEEKVEEAPHFASDAIARSGDWSQRDDKCAAATGEYRMNRAEWILG